MSPSEFYEDSSGNLQPDRRKKRERRSESVGDQADGDRRLRLRRKDDWHRLDREHAEWVEEALEDFTSTHDLP